MKEAKARGGIAGRETSDSREERSRRRRRLCADCLLAEAHDLGFARCRWHVTVDFFFFHDVRLPPISRVDGWSPPPPPPPNLRLVSLLTFSAGASACRGDVRRRAVPCPSPRQPTFLLLLLLLLLFSHRRRLFCCWVVLGFFFLFQK
jgi:MYXO-CTERM domain-containing protein